ncbi:hypothetical protein [Flavobacterium gilvum]|uniref:Uncharacterized protein n=1 Tax=Flavobacterium gilvum TaxID=1492737 RepID=A0AAC9I3F3_9FLAO|nr:hypothetical protein [Flavobacterium gilvum]AOW08880.1 hypothetical protein EM308_04820 [Flavobacterium gilvum]KFC60960.1 hypothetical protein FEM08_02710 [Flavobacterium gilvum]
MKKILLFFILIQCNSLLSQTVLATAPLEFKKSKDYRQVINAENTSTHEVFVFASDKETLTILKYNSALFLTNQFSLPRPDTNYKLLSGYSFNGNGNPTLYWSNADFTKILAVQYDLDTKTNIAQISYEQQFFNQTIITQFQANDTFYILTQKHFEEKLMLYVFKDGKKEEKTLDFGSFKFKNSKNQPVSFSKILEVLPIEKIETNQFNPLFKGSEKTKLYALKNRLLLTLDHDDNETQAFDIDLATFEIKEKHFHKSQTKNYVSLSNSYYHEGKIYQIKVNAEELLFEIKDYNTGDSIKSITTAKTSAIPYKTSPLWLQLEGQRPKEIKNTEKFLHQLVYLEVGLTVYKTPKAILITMGGTGNIQFTDVANTFSSNDPSVSDLMYHYIPTTAYFESLFDKKLENNRQDQEPLAVDFISRFTQENPDITLVNVMRYNNYYILGYYDNDNKEYVMRKFIDGFDR